MTSFRRIFTYKIETFQLPFINKKNCLDVTLVA